MTSMIILGIETSCDETAAAVLERKNWGVQILSNVVASSATIQSKYGGIIPEQAAREQLKSMTPVIEESLQVSGYSGQEIDAIAVTYGPGLIGSLLVGVETAKVLATVWKKPLIPVNHLLGHFYANWIIHLPGVSFDFAQDKQAHLEGGIPQFPCMGLLISGGHTDLVLFKDHGRYEYLGGTRDDAAGECFDKCARLLNLPYPGGPQISKLAAQGDALKFKLPRPMIDSKDFDFSFSGLKTAVANLLSTSEVNLNSSEVKCNLAASIEQAIIDPLIKKTLAAAKKHGVNQLIVAGGVAANQELKKELQLKCEELEITLHIPSPQLCTDNAAMVASAAFFEKPITNPLNLQANPNLSLSPS